MLSRMSSREVTEWRAYEMVSGPFGAERDDTLAALVAYYVTSALGAKQVTMEKLQPKWDRPKAMSWQNMKKVAEAITHMFSGNDERGG